METILRLICLMVLSFCHRIVHIERRLLDAPHNWKMETKKCEINFASKKDVLILLNARLYYYHRIVLLRQWRIRTHTFTRTRICKSYYCVHTFNIFHIQWKSFEPMVFSHFIAPADAKTKCARVFEPIPQQTHTSSDTCASKSFFYVP